MIKKTKIKTIISHIINMLNVFIGLSIISVILLLSLFKIGDINKTFKWLDKNFPIIQNVGIFNALFGIIFTFSFWVFIVYLFIKFLKTIIL
jgi:hypothetical protein